MQTTCTYAATPPSKPTLGIGGKLMTALIVLVIWVEYGFRILLNTGL